MWPRLSLCFSVLSMGVNAIYENQTETYGCNIGNFYTFDWTDVYNLNSKMPQGCKCEKKSSLDSECVAFDCDCSCDLTAGSCDYNCCCDPDCSVAEVLRFEQSDAGCILHENEPDFQQCYNVERVNERYDMEYAGTSKQAINDLLCVESDNADVKGTFFNDPGSFEGDTSVFDESDGQKEYSYRDVIPGSSAERGSETVYYRGDVMRAATESASRAAFGGFLPLPTAGADGQCIESNYAHYMEPVRDNTCHRYVDDLENACSYDLNPARFTKLSVCDSYKSSFTGCASHWVDVQVGTVKYRDLETAQETKLDGSSSEWGSVFSVDTCSYALTDSCFYVSYTAGGAITKVVVDLTVTNITSTSSFVFKQDYSLEFIRSGSPQNPNAEVEGNTVLRGRSGNPGYIIGKPLLSGAKLTEGISSAIQAVIPGLQVYNAGYSPYCDDNMPSTTVNFGEDMITGCILRASFQNLTDMCSQSGNFMKSVDSVTVKVPKYLWFNSSFNYVGIFGNADPLDTSQWLEMVVQDQTSIPTMDSSERSCKKLVTSLNYEFLVSKVGSVYNPQSKVIGARVFYKTETIVYASESSSLQDIMLTTTVSFVDYDAEKSKTYSPPPPPILLSVPYDIFYPFEVNAALSSKGSGSSALMVGLLFIVANALGLCYLNQD